MGRLAQERSEKSVNQRVIKCFFSKKSMAYFKQRISQQKGLLEEFTGRERPRFALFKGRKVLLEYLFEEGVIDPVKINVHGYVVSESGRGEQGDEKVYQVEQLKEKERFAFRRKNKEGAAFAWQENLTFVLEES